MTDPSLQADLRLALDAVARATALVAGHFRTGLEVRYKDPEQPVTEADLAADAVLREALLAARPAYGWLSEETADDPSRLEREWAWCVDPIDGTNSFVAGVPEFTVCVGLVRGDRPVLGVVANPATGTVYHAVAGGGAFRDGQPLRVTGAGAAGRIAVSRSELQRELFVAFDGWTLHPCGSTALKMCRVAEGATDAFVSFGPKHEWDVCAAELIVAEAGGRTSRLDGAPFRYNQPHPGWQGMVCSNGAAHAALLGRVGAAG